MHIYRIEGSRWSIIYIRFLYSQNLYWFLRWSHQSSHWIWITFDGLCI